MPASLIAKEEFYVKHPALRRQNGRDRLEQRLPGILEVMYGGQRDWRAIAKSYDGKSKDTFDGYIKRLRTERLVAADSYELTGEGGAAARIFVPSIGLEEALEDGDFSLLSSKFKPDIQPDKSMQSVRLVEPDRKPDSIRTTP